MADKKISELNVGAALAGTERIPMVQAGATVTTTPATIAALANQDHGLLTGTADDDHPQYHNNARGDARYPPLARVVAAGDGLTGGGDLSANRTLSVLLPANSGLSVSVNGVQVDINGTTVLSGAVDGANDLLLLWDASAAALRRVSVTNALAAAAGSVPDTRQVIAGAGVTGGGALSADVTINVGAGTGVSVAADSVGLDTAHARNADHSAISISAGTGLTGGGTIDANRSLALDTGNTRNVDHAAISITAGAGLTGGGDITASRTLNVGAGTGITVNADDVALANMAQATVKGRALASGTGAPVDLTAAQLTAIVESIGLRNITAKAGVNKTLQNGGSPSGGADGDIIYIW